MNSGINIREAKIEDIPFLAKIILLAETSGKELISYREMFSLSENDLLKGFEKALNNEQLGHGLTYKTFLIAEMNGERGAAACGYIEGEFGSSNHLMTGALINGFGTESVISAFKKNVQFRNIQFNKTDGAFQIDSVATLPDFRGKGLFKLIFEKFCENSLSKTCDTIEIQVWAGNDAAISTYKKLGCNIINEKYLNIEEKNLGGRIVMSKNIS